MALTKVSYSMIDGAPFNVFDYGAIADGVTNDTVAIQSAIDAANDAGGGTVLLPAGTYLVSTSSLTETLWNYGSSVPASAGCLILRDNVQLVGEGIDVTTIKSNDASKTVIQIADGNNIKLAKMTIDGSWSGAAASHGIIQLLTANDNSIVCQNMIFDELFITNVGSYAIGIENGNCYNVIVSNVRTYNSGADAIDFKNRGTLENNTGIFVSNVYIEKYGQRSSLGSGQAGIDIRGVANINNIQVKMTEVTGIGHTGIRFRTASNPAPDEQWGAKSSLTNFYIYSDDALSTNTNNIGLDFGSANVTVSNGYIENCYVGVILSGNSNDVPGNVSVSQVNVNNSSLYGFQVGSGCNFAKFTACSVNNSGTGFRVAGLYCVLMACRVVRTTYSTDIASISEPTLQTIGCVFNETNIGISVLSVGTDVVQITPKGTSTDIDLQLSPRGAGMIKYGVSKAITTETVQRYIEIKDQSGNIRKLAIVA